MSKNTPVVRVVDTHTFIIKAKATHGDRYDYSKSDYKGGQTNIEIDARELGRTRNKEKIKQKILQILLDRLGEIGYITSNNGGLNGK